MEFVPGLLQQIFKVTLQYQLRHNITTSGYEWKEVEALGDNTCTVICAKLRIKKEKLRVPNAQLQVIQNYQIHRKKSDENFGRTLSNLNITSHDFKDLPDFFVKKTFIFLFLWEQA